MSVVDSKLSKYGMKWEVSPYRIVNKHGVVVQEKHFDLRDAVLAKQQEIQPTVVLTDYKFKKVSEYQKG